VSLLSNRSLQVHIGMRSVRGSLRSTWAPNKALARSRHEFAAADDGITERDPEGAIEKPYTAALDAVLSELWGRTARHRPRLRVVMGDARVHFDVVHGNYGETSDRQLQSIASACMTEIFGEAASTQTVRWQLLPDRRHLLMSSIDRSDLAALEQVTRRHGLQLDSLQADFCIQWNHYAGVLPAADSVFATCHDGYATVAFACAGAISALSCGPCLAADDAQAAGSSGGPTVDQRVDRLLASLGIDMGAVARYMLVTGTPESIPSGSRWRSFEQREGPG